MTDAGAGSGYSVTQDSMAKGATAVESASSRIGSLLASLESDVTTLLSSWRGEGSAAFSSVHQRWLEEQERISKALAGMQSSLQATAQNYAAQEQTETAAYQGIKI